MTNPKTNRWITIIASAALALAVLMSVSGCSKGSEEPVVTKPPAADTAKESLAVAQSALSTMAPDAKLLVVQTAQAVTSTSTPVWAYLFGSPKTDKTYMVYVLEGKSMQADEYGEAGLGKKEWPKVPDLTDWQTDSDAAHQKALTASGTSGTPAYTMGFQTYVPESTEESQSTKAFTWYVSLDAGDGSAKLVEVDAKTGEVTPAN